jgi:VCBS repeat-containing protein
VYGLPPATYRVVATGATIYVTVNDFLATTVESAPASGNVLANDTDGARVTAVDGVSVASVGATTIQGDHGVLLIDASGGYTYTPSTSSAAAIGQTDAFNYTITNSLNQTASSTLSVSIASQFTILVGTSVTDTLTDTAGDDVLDGRESVDTFNLLNGGHDTLLYKVIANDVLGGNGIVISGFPPAGDMVNGFKLGPYETTPDADRIDLSALLVGYVADADGPAHYVGGVATLDAGDSIANYLKTTFSGGNTIVGIVRDGLAGTFAWANLVQLNGVQTDLATLLANHQIVVG